MWYQHDRRYVYHSQRCSLIAIVLRMNRMWRNFFADRSMLNWLLYLSLADVDDKLKWWHQCKWCLLYCDQTSNGDTSDIIAEFFSHYFFSHYFCACILLPSSFFRVWFCFLFVDTDSEQQQNKWFVCWVFGVKKYDFNPKTS